MYILLSCSFAKHAKNCSCQSNLLQITMETHFSTTNTNTICIHNILGCYQVQPSARYCLSTGWHCFASVTLMLQYKLADFLHNYINIYVNMCMISADLVLYKDGAVGLTSGGSSQCESTDAGCTRQSCRHQYDAR